MKHRLLTLAWVILMALSFAACGSAPAVETEAHAEGKVLNIYAEDETFKRLFEAYYAEHIPDAVTVNWMICSDEAGEYEEMLDNALLEQDEVDEDDKVDLFLVESDNLLKYVNSDISQDVTALGVTDFSNAYEYTVQACTDTNGVTKGISFQCCPSALLYRRSIAQAVLGTDDPTKVQNALSDWAKFESVAEDARDKGYLMTASFAETYPAFFNSIASPWVDDDGNLQMDPQLEAWINQAENLISKDATLAADAWDDEIQEQMRPEGKTMCFFSPAWYYNLSMDAAKDFETYCFGDWAICEGPVAHFGGGTWLLAATDSDNPSIIADIMNAFINNEEICDQLVATEHLFSNNKAVNQKYAEDCSYGNDFFNGQNDMAVYVAIADQIRFENRTVYDEFLNECLQKRIQEYLGGSISKEEAVENFYIDVNEMYPTILTPIPR